MAHLIGTAAIIVGCWIVLALLVTLALGRWLQRASRVPTGPDTYGERVRSVARGAGRLLLLPYVVESSARGQARRRAGRSRVVQRRDAVAMTERDILEGMEPSASVGSSGETG